MDNKKAIQTPKEKYLGDFVLHPYHFVHLDKAIDSLKKKEYQELNHLQKSDRVNKALLELILHAPQQTFLLIAVLQFMDRIAKEDLLIHYTLSSFELWLNQASGLSEAENYEVRAKIVGKFIPRDAYQNLFPIGMGKMHAGSHFITAHSSPDLDTTIASFWGFVDAFGARVSEGMHIWNLPGGPPKTNIEISLLFRNIFGQDVFKHIAKTRESLSLSSLELMTQRGMVKQKTDQSSTSIEYERSQKAIVLVDEQGYFLGDWRSFDVEGVRQLVIMLNNYLRAFENNLHLKLVTFFAKPKVTKKELSRFFEEVFESKIKDYVGAKEFSEKQEKHMEGYLRKVLKVEKGMKATFTEFAASMDSLSLSTFQECIEQFKKLELLFNKEGGLVEDRPKLFDQLEKSISQLDLAIQMVRLYTEKLEVALNIKTQVFGYLPQVISYRADVDEVKAKMGNYPYLTVTSSDEKGRMIPLGVIRSSDLQQSILATVTLRDFCNREETKIPPYFEVISVIDHHKTLLQTSTPPTVSISDVQSSNTLVANFAFEVNDLYGIGSSSLQEIEKQIQKTQQDLSSPSNRRLMQRLLKKLHAAHAKKIYFIDPLREFVEYLHFLYAILDDTDLLTKVCRKDVECVKELLNRLKSLVEGKETEIVHFDDIVEDDRFVEKAATRILQNQDMYSLYRKIYLVKEELVEQNIQLCFQEKESTFFADTKLQNGCVSIGQAKLFTNNFPSFKKYAFYLKKIWVEKSLLFFADRRQFDLYLHMVSTVPSAEDVYTGESGKYQHMDELWIWIPMTEQSIEHLKVFLNAFSASPQILEYEKQLQVEFTGSNAKELSMIFKESFLSIPHYFQEEGSEFSMATIRFPAGTINSRKAMISPYLPKLLD